jgi:hypothetical protein
MNNCPEQISEIENKYSLRFDESKSEFSGNLYVEQNDCYQISIDITPFPSSFPIVKELGERIPRKADRHLYSDASCCLTTKAKEQLLLKKNKTLDVFIADIVIPFFQNNLYFEINKTYIKGDYKHGIFGVFEAYQEIANITDLRLLLDFLLDRIIRKKYHRNDLCFCNSGLKFKKCHQQNYNDLLLIDKEIIIEDIKLLFEIIKGN